MESNLAEVIMTLIIFPGTQYAFITYIFNNKHLKNNQI